jgi:hypothetical protein
MASVDFYKDLIAFADFHAIADTQQFSALPDDWKVIVADIQGSTKAIEAGRYKDVNTIGAACIVAAQNAMAKCDFPYVFGGDGATLVIPPGREQDVCAALDGVRQLAQDKFGMTLRVGMVEAAELARDGARVEVAKYQLAGKQAIAMFRGGGLAEADKRVKGDPEKYGVSQDPNHEGNLEGLSCRWQAIPAEKGVILSLLVEATRGGEDTYRTVIKQLDGILNGDITTANPVHTSNMSYKSVNELLNEEARLHPSRWSFSFIARACEIVFAVLVFKYQLPPLVFNPQKYADSMTTHSDFRKFDDLLRMVVDCTPAQAAQIRDTLEGYKARGEIHYGVYESDSALMTCFVYGLNEGEHVHFVDGGDGGYALAAKQFKAQKADTAA